VTQCGESHSQSFSCVCINEFSIIKLCIFHSLISFHFFLFFFLFLCVYHVRLGFLCSNVENVFFLIQPRASRASNSHTHTFFLCVFETTSGGSTRQRFKVRIWCQDNGYLGVFFCRLQTKMFCGTVMNWFALTLINLLLSALIERSCPCLKLSCIPKSYPLCCSQIF
jgi:hypothetical protein